MKNRKYYVECDGERVMPLARIALEFSIDEGKMMDFVESYARTHKKANGHGKV